ncbi:Flp family type IVb pilin [Pseudalkalibacillus caeni]|uniref:Flp family type IVb pilin n=1 Tax=Exobacillus caeni TaxID=2574798 RepID=A0A5R9EWG7_9BACL|nr:Flp family type IVb pilin [Pseudalkalibacillus caeni]TLS35572.1 Flp family type IVb pilin [Pseudalkalibacillus caeni]
MTNIFSRLVKEEQGQGMTEYGLILGLVALAAVVALTTMGGSISAKFNEIISKLQGTSTTNG